VCVCTRVEMFPITDRRPLKMITCGGRQKKVDERI